MKAIEIIHQMGEMKAQTIELLRQERNAFRVEVGYIDHALSEDFFAALQKGLNGFEETKYPSIYAAIDNRYAELIEFMQAQLPTVFLIGDPRQISIE